MSEGNRQQLTRDIENKKKRLQRDTQDAQDELQAEQQRVLQTLAQKMMTVVTKYASDNKYSLVVDNSNPSILYTGTGVDITKEVIALYDTMKL